MRTRMWGGAGVYTNFIYENGKLIARYASNEADTAQLQQMYFRYDENGNPLSVVYFNGVEYFYVLNLQGDVIALIDNTGTVVVKYTYDSWGKLLSTTGSMAVTLGYYNPLRYRGYYYDVETGLYYLQSRYYDPETGRFLNADGYVSTVQEIVGNNMFAYCGNTPVTNYDYNGNLFVSKFLKQLVKNTLIAATVGAIIAFRLSVVMYLYSIVGIRIGNNVDFSCILDSIGQIMRSRIKTSGAIRNLIIDAIKRKKTSIDQTMDFGQSIVNASDLDLSMSIANCYINAKLYDAKIGLFGKKYYIVSISIDDKYDFHDLSDVDMNKIKKIINNYLGFWPQEFGIIRPYKWRISFSYVFSY